MDGCLWRFQIVMKHARQPPYTGKSSKSTGIITITEPLAADDLGCRQFAATEKEKGLLWKVTLRFVWAGGV